MGLQSRESRKTSCCLINVSLNWKNLLTTVDLWCAIRGQSVRLHPTRSDFRRFSTPPIYSSVRLSF